MANERGLEGQLAQLPLLIGPCRGPGLNRHMGKPLSPHTCPAVGYPLLAAAGTCTRPPRASGDGVTNDRTACPSAVKSPMLCLPPHPIYKEASRGREKTGRRQGQREGEMLLTLQHAGPSWSTRQRLVSPGKTTTSFLLGSWMFSSALR